jgi:putative SOS response-associated peptidase YedK
MCNLYTQTRSVDEIARTFAAHGMPLRFPEGVPNLEPKDICISDSAPVVRAAEGGPDQYELIERRWSWSGPTGKPVYNFRSDGREFTSGRCIVPASGFYEFTTPADPKQKRKDRWLFRLPGDELIGIAGLVRSAGSGEAFTLLTTPPSEDVQPYHNRQIAILPPNRWQDWLDHAVPAADLLKPLPPGTLVVEASPR